MNATETTAFDEIIILILENKLWNDVHVLIKQDYQCSSKRQHNVVVPADDIRILSSNDYELVIVLTLHISIKLHKLAIFSVYLSSITHI